jgi:PPM family protein phosphatase
MTFYQNVTSVQDTSRCVIRNEINQRKSQEDSFYVGTIIPGIGRSPIELLIIADGMGGYEHGGDVSEQAVRKLTLSLFEALAIVPNINQLEVRAEITIEELKKVLWESIELTQAYIRRTIENNHWNKAGTTIVVAAVMGDDVAIANVGDTPLFHYQASSGKLQQVTEDHSIVATLVRSKMIPPEAAASHHLRNQLEFYLGCTRLQNDPQTYQLKLEPKDLLLLCSDGVNGLLELEELERVMAGTSLTLDDKADRLLKAALDAETTDNQTLILFRHEN